MSEAFNVGVADLKVTNNRGVLASFGLGSCVAVAMFDPEKKVGGLAHVMLPDSRGKDSSQNPGKFADVAVARLLEEMLERGARCERVICKIAGGSHMFEIPGLMRKDSNAAVEMARIGYRNVEAVKRALEDLGIRLVGQDTGGNHGRTIKFDTSTGEVEISSIHHGRVLI